MPNFAVVDMEGKQVGSIDLSESVFGIEPNTAVMHQMVVNYLANQRHGTQSAFFCFFVFCVGCFFWF